MDIFTYDYVKREVILNEYEILLVKEFAALWDKDRNKTKEDPKGEFRTRAYKEFTYIYLMIDW